MGKVRVSEEAERLLVKVAEEANGLGFVGMPTARAVAVAKCPKDSLHSVIIDLQLAGFMFLRAQANHVVTFKITEEGRLAALELEASNAQRN